MISKRIGSNVSHVTVFLNRVILFRDELISGAVTNLHETFKVSVNLCKENPINIPNQTYRSYF